MYVNLLSFFPLNFSLSGRYAENAAAIARGGGGQARRGKNVENWPKLKFRGHEFSPCPTKGKKFKEILPALHFLYLFLPNFAAKSS